MRKSRQCICNLTEHLCGPFPVSEVRLSRLSRSREGFKKVGCVMASRQAEDFNILLCRFTPLDRPYFVALRDAPEQVEPSEEEVHSADREGDMRVATFPRSHKAGAGLSASPHSACRKRDSASHDTAQNLSETERQRRHWCARPIFVSRVARCGGWPLAPTTTRPRSNSVLPAPAPHFRFAWSPQSYLTDKPRSNSIHVRITCPCCSFHVL